MNIEIECPYCNKIHVHRIEVQSRVILEIAEDALPVDPQTEDLLEHLENEVEEHQEEKK